MGQSCTNTSEFLSLTRTAETAYRLQASNGLGLAWHFECIEGGSDRNCVLVRIEDAFGNVLRVAAGAQVLCGGQRLGNTTYAPTVLLNPPRDAKVSTQEVFGPVVCVYGTESLTDAIAHCTL